MPIVFTEYEPYGDEWERYVMREKKADIVEMLRTVAKERDMLRNIVELVGTPKKDDNQSVQS